MQNKDNIITYYLKQLGYNENEIFLLEPCIREQINKRGLPNNPRFVSKKEEDMALEWANEAYVHEFPKTKKNEC